MTSVYSCTDGGPHGDVQADAVEGSVEGGRGEESAQRRPEGLDDLPCRSHRHRRPQRHHVQLRNVCRPVRKVLPSTDGGAEYVESSFVFVSPQSNHQWPD